MLYALNATTGEEMWSFDVGGDVKNTPALSPDGLIIYTGSKKKIMYALNSQTGEIIWTYEANGDIKSGAVVHHQSGAIFFSSKGRKLHAVNGSTGVEIWTFSTKGDIYSSPSLSLNGNILYVTAKKNLHALETGTGVEIWQFSPGDEMKGTAAVGPTGVLYVGSKSKSKSKKGRVFALNGTTGTEIWSFDAADRIEGSPAVGSDGSVCVGSKDNYVYGLNGTTGIMLWSYDTGDDVKGSAVIDAAGICYIGSKSNFVYALQQNGTEIVPSVVWYFNARGDIYGSPALGTNGEVYVGSKSGFVFAIVPAPPPPFTKVSFNTKVTLRNIVASNFDTAAINAFREVTASGLVGVNREDVVVISVVDVPDGSRLKKQSNHVLEVTSTTEVTFTTEVTMEKVEGKYYEDPVEMVDEMDSELTALYEDPATSAKLVDTAVSEGSTTIQEDTTLVIEGSSVDKTSTKISVTTGAPTTVPSMAPTRECLSMSFGLKTVK